MSIGGVQSNHTRQVAAVAARAGRPRHVLGIDASAKPAQTREQVRRIARRTARLIGVERELTDDEVHLDERYHAGTAAARYRRRQGRALAPHLETEYRSMIFSVIAGGFVGGKGALIR